MNGNVFIGWNENLPLAEKVAALLKENGYNAIFKSKLPQANCKGGVLSQMKSCSSAILLFKCQTRPDCSCGGKVNGNLLSANMLYELGFLVGSLKIKKVFTVYIDGAEASAPSDLKGMWDISVYSAGKSIDELAKEIVDQFVYEQCNELNENKIELVTDISRLSGLIESHRENPVYFESELAELILLYCQSSYMFGVMAKGKKILTNLLKSDHSLDERVELAINSSLCYYEICEKLQLRKDGDDKTLYLPKDAYIELKAKLLAQIEKVEKMKDDEFRRMFLMVDYDYITFANMMYYLNSGINSDFEFRDFCIEKSIETCEKFRSYDPDKNDQLASLYESYGYRNAALYFRKTDRVEEASYSFDKSRSARYKLLKYFHNKDMDKNIFEQIKMEYYLSLTDDLDTSVGLERKRRLRELEDYLEEVNEASLDKNYLIAKIEKIINSVESFKTDESYEEKDCEAIPLAFTFSLGDEVVRKAFSDNKEDKKNEG